MAISKARAATTKREGRPPVTLEVSGEPCRFREPRTSDLAPPAAIVQMMSTDFADIPAARQAEIALLGACYLPDAGEGGINPTRLIAEIARDDEYVYVDLSSRFSAAFPEFVNWLSGKAQAKNDSRQESETPSSTA